MRELKRSECAVLPLVLKGLWYDMILYGEKHEEYRDFKAYWINRICKYWNNAKDEDIFRDKPLIKVVAFSRGYCKPDLFFIIEDISTRAKSVHPEWGEPSAQHFVITLGERIEFEDKKC